MNPIKLYTIGFAKKDAKIFFSLLKKNSITRIIDIRLNNSSQLAGFTKKNDLAYFLKEICHCDYKYVPLMAPTKQILEQYKKEGNDWNTYEMCFKALIQERGIEKLIALDELDNACLLCSEVLPAKCHRRLVAEYLQEKFKNIEIIHL